MPNAPADPATATYAPALKVDLAASTRTASGLYYRDIKVGNGAEAVAGRQVAAKYDGTLVDGTRFDSGVYPFVLGARRVIAGWDEGVAGMRVGGVRQLIVPPALGYADRPMGPIPPNSILVFTVELVSVQ